MMSTPDRDIGSLYVETHFCYDDKLEDGNLSDA